jgi:hypothetical protein
VGNCGKNV